MIDADIYNDFAEAVAVFAAATSPPLPVSYPGVHFTPPDAGAWLEVRWFPNETQNWGIGNDGPSVMQGFGQVSVYYRPGAGIVDGLLLAGAIVDAFPKGTQLARASVQRKPWISAVVSDGDKVFHPVTIPYKATVNG